MEDQPEQVGLLYAHFRMYADLMKIDVQTQAEALCMLLFDLAEKKFFTQEELEQIVFSIMQVTEITDD